MVGEKHHENDNRPCHQRRRTETMHHTYQLITAICILTLISACPACAWTTGIDIATGNATYDLHYGIEPNSTAECDNGIDSIVPPPAPGMKKAAYFVTTGAFRELSTDIRPETGWQLFLMSDENISITWDSPPVPLRLGMVSTTRSDSVLSPVPDMRSETDITLLPGTHILAITAGTTSGDDENSGGDTGDSDDSGAIYQPPQVVTAATPVATDTPLPQTPSPDGGETTIPQNSEVQLPENPDGNDTNAGPTVPMPVMPSNSTATPTKTPVSIAAPLAGLGVTIALSMRNNRFK